MTPRQFKKHRAALGLTQKALADLWGIHHITVSRYETGTMPIPIMAERLLRIETFDINIKPVDAWREAMGVATAVCATALIPSGTKLAEHLHKIPNPYEVKK